LGITNPNEVYEEEGWFLNLPPVKGAVEAFEYLNSRDDIEGATIKLKQVTY
jgi:hypothetical protein